VEVVVAVVEAGVLEGVGVDVDSGMVVRNCAVPRLKRLVAVQLQPAMSQQQNSPISQAMRPFPSTGSAG
jgi:hypothetical protein